MSLTHLFSHGENSYILVCLQPVYSCLYILNIVETYKRKPSTLVSCQGWGSNILLVCYISKFYEISQYGCDISQYSWSEHRVYISVHTHQMYLCLWELYVNESQRNHPWQCVCLFVCLFVCLKHSLRPNSDSLLFGSKITVFSAVCIPQDESIGRRMSSQIFNRCLWKAKAQKELKSKRWWGLTVCL